MHSLQIIHGDIKPENVMFSPSLQKYVFVDFGLSRILAQKRGQTTFTHYFGTPPFSSAEMRKLYEEDTTGEVDLYKNDEHCLNITL